ncbi:hypothetical protein Syun_018192 [Stephania yunnanensis]|uniref:Bulb-type lectin domain-containing protein n=1 Tax=Stephania yunnanensis TaxID=152371 RepID=A0AAP0ISG2_9MAGN
MAQAIQAIPVLTIVVALTLTSAPISVVAADNMITAGQSLGADQYLQNGPYKFIMQSDCNLVLYVNQNTALWSSKTNGAGTSCTATLMNDGSLVVQSGTNTLWSSGKTGGTNSYWLIVQTDGNVVIYGSPLWATGTVQS